MTNPDYCKHLDLCVERNNGYRWVTCGQCMATFERTEVLMTRSEALDHLIEAIREVGHDATINAMQEVLDHYWPEESPT